MQNDDIYDSPIKSFFKNKWVRFVLIVDIVIIIAIIVAFIINATKVSTIELNIAPIDATISINGNQNYENGSYSITPGTYEIKISREGLDSKTLTVDIPSHYYVTVSAFLSDDGSFEFYELKDNFRSFEKLREIASADNNITTDHDTSAESFIANLEHAMSIQELLPIKGYVYADPEANASTAGFAIRYGGEGCKITACLLVNYYGKNYEQAVMEEIRSVGYDPADYQIIYERYNY